MQALIRNRYGGPDVLQVREIEAPVARDGEVLVRVHAASINDWDWGLLHGPTLPISLGPPRVKILGSDIAGRVVQVGKDVRDLRVGDEVYGDLSRFGPGGWGGLAEYVCARERALALKPAGMTFEQAAALPQAGQLAVQGLAAGGPPRAGLTLLINGGGGGVGTLGVQLAKAQRMEVTGVDRASKHAMMRNIGFDHVIDYESEDFTRNGRRYDLILDTKTEHSPFRYGRSLTPQGTYVSLGGPKIGKLLAIAAYGWCRRVAPGQSFRLIALTQNRDLAYLNQCFDAGQLIPVIDGPYRLHEAPEALRRFGAGNHTGKVVIRLM
jgi:NADPH:quinone reductase-like Zn-dependent oxidoreductase